MARKRRRNRFEFLKRKFPKKMQTKLVMLFMGVVLVFVILIGRITYINASNGDKYTKLVLDQQEYNSKVIPYKRGDILDRNGTKIATSERVYNVILDIQELLSNEEALNPTVKVLVDCFGLDETELRKTIEDNPTSRYQILQKNISYDKSKEFEAIDEDNKAYPNVYGIWLEEDYNRIYPYNSMASDVIGFTTADNNGTVGIESSYNDILNGTNGREYGYLSDDTSLQRTVKQATNGNTVVSTIDVTLQSMIEQSILEFNEAHRGETRKDDLGSKNTAVIVMDPNSGEILAETSYPNFDLNNPRDLSSIYKEEKLSAMSDEELNAAYNELWRNFCVSDAFEPGSTAKPFTVAAGLETGAINGSEVYNCGGVLHVGDYDIHCHLRSGHGSQTVEQAIANSCNVALMQIAEAIGTEDFCRYQKLFGFGQYTGIDLPGEAATSSLLYTADTMEVTDLATNSFGQNFNVTMTQMVAAYASLINGGYFYEPHVVKQIQDESGNVLETKNPVLLRKTISEETSVMVKQYMKAVLDYGTAESVQVEGYDIGGKTGTAEKIPRDQGNYVLSFIGYAPQDNPEVVVYVVVDEPNIADQSASSYSNELSQKILAQILPYLNITRTEGYVAKSAESTDEADGTAAAEDAGYTDYDSSYQEDYSNQAGNYSDENYSGDYTDWAAGTVITDTEAVN